MNGALRHTTAVSLAALLVAGCGGSPPLPTFTAPTGDPSAVTVTLNAGPSAVPGGDPIEVVVMMTNTGALPVTLHFNSGCLLVFTVRNGAGEVVGPGPWACTDDTPIVELKPGERRLMRFDWRTSTGYGTGAQPLPPGTYQLVGAVTAAETRAQSAPVAIEVTP